MTTEQITTQTAAEPTSTNATMIDMVETKVEDQATPAAEEKKTETPAEPQKEKPAGWDQVDFNELPPEQRAKFESRFNRVYKQLKDHERQWQTAAEYISSLEEKLDKIDSRTSQDSLSAEEREIESLGLAAQQAYANGNNDLGLELIRKMAAKEGQLAYKKEQLAEQEKQRKTEKKASPVQPAVSFTDNDKVQIMEWQKEHEWAKPGHPFQPKVAEYLSQMITDPQFSHMTLQEKLDQTTAAWDEHMNKVLGRKPQTQPAKQGVQVLGNGLPAAVGTPKEPALSDQEKIVATRLFPKLSKLDAYKKYAKGKA